jgi:hypothetical protein
VRDNDIDAPTTSDNIKPISSMLKKEENIDKEAQNEEI